MRPQNGLVLAFVEKGPQHADGEELLARLVVVQRTRKKVDEADGVVVPGECQGLLEAGVLGLWQPSGSSD
jgi:hypothetical protein